MVKLVCINVGENSRCIHQYGVYESENWHEASDECIIVNDIGSKNYYSKSQFVVIPNGAKLVVCNDADRSGFLEMGAYYFLYDNRNNDDYCDIQCIGDTNIHVGVFKNRFSEVQDINVEQIKEEVKPMIFEINEGNMKEISKYFASYRENAVNTAKNRIKQIEDSIKYYLNNLRLEYEKRKAQFDIIQKQESDIKFAVNKLASLNQVEKIEKACIDFDTDELIVYTKDLYFRTLNGGRYYLGKATIRYNIKTGDIYFDTDNPRRSYWGYECPHPHVSDEGNACLGNTGEIIASLSADKEYGLIMEVLISFLEQANTDDCAGKFAMNWDKVDEDGNIIQEGFVDYSNSLFYYGETPDKDSVGKAIVCSDCGETYSEDVMTLVDGEWVCNECLEHGDYYYCHECGTCHYTDNIRWLDHYGYYVCDECLEDYTWCSDCDEYYRNDDIRFTPDNHALCEDCYEKRKSDGEFEEEEVKEEVAVSTQHICIECGCEVHAGEETIYDGQVYCTSCVVSKL